MINFEAVDFSERRPEEVISFFWRSVYIAYILYNRSNKFHVYIYIYITNVILFIHSSYIKHVQYLGADPVFSLEGGGGGGAKDVHARARARQSFTASRGFSRSLLLSAPYF